MYVRRNRKVCGYVKTQKFKSGKCKITMFAQVNGLVCPCCGGRRIFPSIDPAKALCRDCNHVLKLEEKNG